MANALDVGTRAEVQRVLAGGKNVYLRGGPEALSTAIDGQLTSLGYQVNRVQGATRYSTAVAIAGALGHPSKVFEVTGVNFPDGLCGGAAAPKAGAAVLLTNGNQQAPETAAYLSAHPSAQRTALGGPAAAADPSAASVVGTDRYDTCAKVATTFFRQPTVVGVATGQAFADALTGGAHIARRGGPLLLTTRDDLPAVSTNDLSTHKGTIDARVIYGGVSAVSLAAESEIDAALAEAWRRPAAGSRDDGRHGTTGTAIPSAHHPNGVRPWGACPRAPAAVETPGSRRRVPP